MANSQSGFEISSVIGADNGLSTSIKDIPLGFLIATSVDNNIDGSRWRISKNIGYDFHACIEIDLILCAKESIFKFLLFKSNPHNPAIHFRDTFKKEFPNGK